MRLEPEIVFKSEKIAHFTSLFLFSVSYYYNRKWIIQKFGKKSYIFVIFKKRISSRFIFGYSHLKRMSALVHTVTNNLDISSYSNE